MQNDSLDVFLFYEDVGGPDKSYQCMAFPGPVQGQKVVT